MASVCTTPGRRAVCHAEAGFRSGEKLSTRSIILRGEYDNETLNCVGHRWRGAIGPAIVRGLVSAVRSVRILPSLSNPDQPRSFLPCMKWS